MLGMEMRVHVLAAHRVGRHGSHQRGIDAAGQAQAHALEMVLGHVILQTQHAGGVLLPRPDRAWLRYVPTF